VAWALDVGIAVSWRMYVAPASLTLLDVGARGPRLVGFNSTAHLEP
jgi:hypothetical protein